MKMKRFTMFCLILCLCAAMSSTAFAARERETSLKIGVIDIQKIMKTSKAAKNAQATFNKEVQSRKNKFSTREKEVRAMEEELKKTDTKWSAGVRKEKSEKLAKAVKDLKRLGSDMEEELRQKNSELSRKIMEDIRTIINNVFQKEQYTLILERNSVIIADDSIDITDKIIRIYDAQKE